MPTIIKADGTREPFDPLRLVSSLMRAGAGPAVAESIAGSITSSLVPDTPSRDIYAKAFALLRKNARPIAARYALRRAMLEFGPSGHPFEDFVSHLFRKEGWQVETRKMMQGKCVMHEVDFYAGHEGQGEHIGAELKYHNDPSYKTDLKTALYVKARFEDIFACDPSARSCPLDRGMLVTNTKFTSEVIAYASCAGLELLGWSYPENNSLFIRMSEARVYPITTLTSLEKAEKRLLIDHGVVAVDSLLEDKASLDVLHLPPERVGDIRAEAEGLLALAHPFAS